MQIRAGILTISDAGSRGERVDTSGPAINELLSVIEADVQRYQVIPDEHEQIAEALRSWADSGELDLILTTGGTGLSPRDVTPEATAGAIDRTVPGLAEVMRREGYQKTPMAALSRGITGARGRCLILNLPGSERGVRESLGAVISLLPHAIDLLRGRAGDHVAPAASPPPPQT